MGWTKVADLKVEKTKFPVDGCILLTRGGLDGLQVCTDNREISIQKEIILDLVAEEYYNRMIAKYESMSNENLLKEIFE